MKNWREIRRDRKSERKYLVEQAKLDAWLDEDFPKYLAERAALYAALLRVLDDRCRRLCEQDDPAPFPVERSRRHFRRKLLRVLDARFCQLVEAAWEDNALWAFRQDLVRVLAAREDQLFWRRMSESQARIDRLMRRWYRTGLCRVLRRRHRSLLPKAIGCPRCGHKGLNVETVDRECFVCNGGWVCWTWKERTTDGYEATIVSPEYPLELLAYRP